MFHDMINPFWNDVMDWIFTVFDELKRLNCPITCIRAYYKNGQVMDKISKPDVIPLIVVI